MQNVIFTIRKPCHQLHESYAYYIAYGTCIDHCCVLRAIYDPAYENENVIGAVHEWVLDEAHDKLEEYFVDPLGGDFE